MNSYYIKILTLKHKMEACFISKTVTQVTSLSISASFASKFQHFLLFMCERFPTC